MEPGHAGRILHGQQAFAQRSLRLQHAGSPSRLMRPSTPEAPAVLLPPPPLRLLPDGANQFLGSGRDSVLLPSGRCRVGLKTSIFVASDEAALASRRQRQLLTNGFVAISRGI